MNRIIFIFSFFICCCWKLSAHEVRPAFLHITQLDSSNYSTLWKVPLNAGRSLSIKPIMPDGFTLTKEREISKASALIEIFTTNSSIPLAGRSISISNLEKTLVDVLVRIDLLDGISHSFILQADKPSVIIPHQPNVLEVLKSYIVLGIEHILMGYDHLLFVLALLLLVPSIKSLFWTITSFTLAHSITLALASLQLFRLPSAPVEAVIALSIIFLAREYLQVIRGRKSLTAKYPWSVSFTFGLLHGFGFAGALTEIGFPQNQIFAALLSFNIGVELGQMFFVIFCVILFYIFKKMRRSEFSIRYKTMASYALGSVASFWFIERCFNMLF